VLVLSDAHVGEEVNGNLLLDHILDVKIHRVKTSEERKPKMKQIADELKKNGRNPYIIPTGGSNKIGVLGYVNFVKEIAEQSKQMGITFDYFVHPTALIEDDVIIGDGTKGWHQVQIRKGASIGAADSSQISTGKARKYGYRVTNEPEVSMKPNDMPLKGFSPNNPNLPKDV